MPKFNVEFSALAVVRSSATVEAENEEEAREKALSDNVQWELEWRYDGLDEGMDSDPRIESIRRE